MVNFFVNVLFYKVVMGAVSENAFINGGQYNLEIILLVN